MYIITIILHYAIGWGLLNKLGFRRNGWEIFGLAFPLGLGSGTVAVFLMDVMGIPLTTFSTTLVFLIMAAALIYPWRSGIKAVAWPHIPRSIGKIKKISLVEWISLGMIFALCLPSLWRCFYLPVTPYDSIHGIDLVAKYAVQDGKINSSMFSDVGQYLSTQPYYAPFAALSQTIYRLAGHPFGKIWLALMFLSLLVVFYVNLRKKIHPALAGFLTIVLISIPELYAYTFLLQTDFSNAVFVSISVIYAFRFIKERETKYFWLSSILFGFGAWSRSETLAFAIIAAILIILFTLSDKPLPSFKLGLIFFSMSFLFFAVWNLYYLPYVLEYTPESYFKFGFWDPERLSTIWKGMWIILSDTAYWGYVLHFFFAMAAINLLFFHDRGNLFILLWIILLFCGFLVLLYHLQLGLYANVNYTFRRGSFKLWPIMIFYIGTSALFVRVSEKIENWQRIK